MQFTCSPRWRPNLAETCRRDIKFTFALHSTLWTMLYLISELYMYICRYTMHTTTIQDCSSQNSQQTVICPCFYSEKSMPFLLSLLDHFNTRLSSTSRSSRWSLTFISFHQNPARIPLLHHTCHMPPSPHLILSCCITQVIFGEKYR